jgi:hypothetical protein
VLSTFAAVVAGATLLVATAHCGPSRDPSSSRSAIADQWLERGRRSFRTGDFDDANDSVNAALKAAPKDAETRIFAAHVALSRLDFPSAIKLTEGIDASEAHRVRGRAHWYAGDVEQAAEELDALLADPKVKDPWAQAVEKLAHRSAGRKPYSMEGGLVAAIEMPRVGPALVVPCELEGERILAMVSTLVSEVTVDAASRKEPAWVHLRFGDIEVKDVPALTQDLSSIARQYQAPIKALLGVNLLRRLNATFDRRGDQFVVRRNEPTAPPVATRLPAYYVRGGAMVVHGFVGPQDSSRVTLLMDAASPFAVALEDGAWRKAGIDPTTLPAEPGLPGIRAGVLPHFKLGTFDLPRIPAAAGLKVSDLKSEVQVDVDGMVGGGLLAVFRVTMADEGRTLWLEPDPELATARAGGPPPERTESAPPSSTPAASPPSPAATPVAPKAAPSTKGSSKSAPPGKKP